MSDEQANIEPAAPLSFAPQYQAELLAACYQDAATFGEIKSYTPAAAFTIPQLRWLYELGKHTLETTGGLPSLGLVAQEASSVFTAGEEFNTLIEVHREIATILEPSRAIVERAATFAQQAKFREVMEQANRMYHSGRYADAQALIDKASWKLIEAGGAKSTRRISYGYDEFDAFHDRARERRDSPASFKLSTGILGLDELLDGGYQIGHLLVILGFTGRGKSTLILNFIDANIMAGRGGALLVSEMTPDSIMAKLYARRARIGQNIIYAYSFTPEQERDYLTRMDEYKARLARLLFIEQLGTTGMTRERIVRAKDDARVYLKDFVWMGVDTVDHIVIGDEYKHDERAGRTAAANWLHELLDQEKLAGLATSQANRAGFGWTDLDNAANTMEFARVAENVVAVNEDASSDGTRPNLGGDNIEALLAPRDRLGGMILTAAKVRHGRKGDVPVSTQLACSFIGDAQMDREGRQNEGGL